MVTSFWTSHRPHANGEDTPGCHRSKTTARGWTRCSALSKSTSCQISFWSCNGLSKSTLYWIGNRASPDFVDGKRLEQAIGRKRALLAAHLSTTPNDISIPSFVQDSSIRIAPPDSIMRLSVIFVAVALPLLSAAHITSLKARQVPGGHCKPDDLKCCDSVAVSALPVSGACVLAIATVG